MIKTDITPNDDASVTIRLNEEEPNMIEKFADTRQTLADATEVCVCGILWGGVSSVHWEYKMRALAIGMLALELDEFWHRFRRRFPGTFWGFANAASDEQLSICNAVFVFLGPEDKSLISQIDKFGRFPGVAVIDAFIETQDSFSGEPHPGDEIETFDIRERWRSASECSGGWWHCHNRD